MLRQGATRQKTTEPIKKETSVASQTVWTELLIIMGSIVFLSCRSRPVKDWVKGVVLLDDKGLCFGLDSMSLCACGLNSQC